MILRRRPPAVPFEAIADALDDPAGRATFIRGLTLGALVGAAVVGSLLRARKVRSGVRPRTLGETEGPSGLDDEIGPPAKEPTSPT